MAAQVNAEPRGELSLLSAAHREGLLHVFGGDFAHQFPADFLGEVFQFIDVGVLGGPFPVQPVHDAG